MYPAYHSIAKEQGNNQAVRSINYALKSEVDHKGHVHRTPASRSSPARTSPTSRCNVCLICGHTVIGDAPDKCPYCAAPKDLYRTF